MVFVGEKGTTNIVLQKLALSKLYMSFVRNHELSKFLMSTKVLPLEKFTLYISVLEIMVSVWTLSDHFGILSDPKRFGSDIWLSTT